MNPRITEVHAGEKRWGAEFAALRRLCLDAGLHEDLKWGQACHDLDGRNVVLIHGFRDYCALLFMKGSLMRDPEGLLVQQTRDVQSARQLRFADLAEIERHRPAVEACLADAIEVERAGAKVAMKAVSEFPVPAEFAASLDDDPALAEAFHALTPGRRKAYLLHFAGAKRAETRATRVRKHLPRILNGLGLDD